MPTVNYIRDLLGDEYIFNVDIDPRKFKEYNLIEFLRLLIKNMFTLEQYLQFLH